MACKNSDVKKNVLFIMVDDFRPEINSWGSTYMKTPNIDRLADKGVSYTNAYCQYANSSPSRRSILTGLSPETTGHETHYDEYKRYVDHTSMPEYFREQGYFTASLGKVYHVKGEDASWNYVYDITDNKWECYAEEKNKKMKHTRRPAVECSDLPLEKYTDYKICQETLKLLEDNREQNFFIAVGFRKPHLPYAAPKRFWDLYQRDSIPITKYPNAPLYGDTIVYKWSELANYSRYNTVYAASNYRDIKIGEEDLRMLQHGYMACVSYVDYLIGLLLDKLEELELDDNTLIVLMGDHGYHLGDQQIYGKHTCYHKAVNIPLIIYAPDLERSVAKCSDFVEGIDVYPTVVDFCNFSIPKGLDGKSFRVLYDRIGKGQDFNAAFNQYQSFQKGDIRNYMGYAIHTANFTYIEWQNLKDGRKVMNRELYRVSPKQQIETENIASEKYGLLMDSLSAKISEKFAPYRLAHEHFLKLKKK